jgi:hypothetical protein
VSTAVFSFIIVIIFIVGSVTIIIGYINICSHRLRVFENRILRRIFGPKRDEVTGEWRKLHSEEHHSLYSSPDIIRQVKSRRMRWAGHVVRMGEGEKCTEFWRESPKERDRSED